jgi:hypothetical protein
MSGLVAQLLMPLVPDPPTGNWAGNQITHLVIRCLESGNVRQENCTLGGGDAGFCHGSFTIGLRALGFGLRDLVSAAAALRNDITLSTYIMKEIKSLEKSAGL